jgi:hypothetical protein
MRLELVRSPDALHRAQREPIALAIARPVQWVAGCGGWVQVSATSWAALSDAIGALPGLRLLSRYRPSTPASRSAVASATPLAG